MSDCLQLPLKTRRKYLERRKLDLALFLDANSKADFAIVETMAHKLRGNGSTFGFSELTDMGLQIELAAQKKAQSVIQEKLRALSFLLDQLLMNLKV